MSEYKFTKSMELFQRACKKIPTGIPGHRGPALSLPGSFPYYAQRAKGCRYWDVDGNEFLDFMCAYGPIVLGYSNPKIEAAVEAQRVYGSCFNHPTEKTVELAEKLTEITPTMDWAVFARNGSDVTMWSMQVAREYTHRRKIIIAKNEYHGSHPWCTPGHGGLIEEDTCHVLTFTWNNADELRDLVRKNEGDVATIMLTPHHHPAFANSELPAPGFYDEVRDICDKHGIVFISDDVRCGFRLNIGGSCEYYRFKPDMILYSKAIANGHQLAAAMGTDKLKKAASTVFFTGTFWHSAAEMVAALATIEQIQATKALDKISKTGKMLQDGLKKRAAAHGLQVTTSGPPPLPYMTFANETNFRRMQCWSRYMVTHGVLVHPHHNWFISAAHEESDIQQALDVADEAFAVVKKEFGS